MTAVKDSDPVGQLFKDLKGVADKWFQIGTLLRVPVSKLKEIEGSCTKDMTRCLIELLHYWIGNSNPTNPLDDIIAVLHDLNLTSLAVQLDSKYRNLTCTPATESYVLDDENSHFAIVPKKEIMNSLMEVRKEYAAMIVAVKENEHSEMNISEVKRMYESQCSEDFEDCESFPNVMDKLSASNCISTFNIKALELMNHHVPPDHEMMQIIKKYEKKKDEFLSSTLVVDLQFDSAQPRLDVLKMAMVIVKIPEYVACKRTLKYIETLAEEAFGDCFESFVHLRVESKSSLVHIIWWYPKHLTLKLRQTDKADFLLEKEVHELSVAGETLFCKEKIEDQGSLIVTVGNETFNILEAPENSSALVKKHESLVLTGVDLNTLVTDLSMVGKFIRIAYNGVAGYTDLQIKIRSIGVNVSKLCDKSAVTVGKFKKTSSTVVMNLQATYGFLIEGNEDIAIVTLQSTASVAQGMAEAAEKLAKAFDEESERVEKVLEDTHRTKDSEEDQKKAFKEEEKKYEIMLEKVAQKSAAVEQDLAFHGQQYARADARQSAYETSEEGLFEAIYNFITGRNDERIRAAREDKKRHLQEMNKLRRIRRRVLQDYADFSKQIINCRNESELSEAAITSLYKAMRGLKGLSKVMTRISLFWLNLESECRELGDQNFQRMIETKMKKPKKERVKFWKSISFKKEVITYYARWVALGKICGEYYERIKVTQRVLHDYLEENYTVEEARQIVQQLAAAFFEELKEKQKAIAESD